MPQLNKIREPRSGWSGWGSTLGGVGLALLLVAGGAGQSRAEAGSQELASLATAPLRASQSDLRDSPDSDAQGRRIRRTYRILRSEGLHNWAEKPVMRSDVTGDIAAVEPADPPVTLARAPKVEQGEPEVAQPRIDPPVRRRGGPDAEPIEAGAADTANNRKPDSGTKSAPSGAKKRDAEIGKRRDEIENIEADKAYVWENSETGEKVRQERFRKLKEPFEYLGEDYADPEGADRIARLKREIAALEKGIELITGEELRRIGGDVFGKWRDTKGNIWEISSPEGRPQHDEVSATPEDQIADIERRIEAIRTDKVYRWINPETGENVVQDRFKRLKEPWEFLGQAPRLENAEAEIARLHGQIDDLRAASKPLPMDAHDPVRMGDMRGDGETQSLTIRVTDREGYSWTYDTAVVNGVRITAKRTLRDVRDITGLPQDVANKLIASWSTPEWIELEAAIERKTGQFFLAGLRWRLHVTYSADWFASGVYDIDGIHTPFSQALRLEKTAVGPKLAFLRIEATGLTPVGPEGVRYGDRFRVEARFDATRDESTMTVDLEWAGGASPLPLQLFRKTGSDRIYLSQPLSMVYDGAPRLLEIPEP